MSYTITQLVRGRPYRYEVEAYWDPVKQQSRQRRKYLGAIDQKTGKLVVKTSQRSISLTKTFGGPYLLDGLARKIHLDENLRNAFGGTGDRILALAIAKLLGKTSLKNIHHVLEDGYINELYGIDKPFPSQRVSEFLADLSRRESEMAMFFKTFIEPEKNALVYDITTLSSYSRNLDWLEYGSDYRWTKLPQVNLGLVLSLERHIPVYYKLFPGSISDVTTLRNLISEVKAFGIAECLFILDRGFYSEGNIHEMVSGGVDFILPMPFSVNAAKLLVSQTNKSLHVPDNGHMFKDELYFVQETEIVIGKHKVQAFVIYNNQRQADERRTLFARMEEFEEKLNGTEIKGNPQEYFETVTGGYSHFFRLIVRDNKMFLERKANAISFVVNRCGKVILLSSKKRSWDEVLSLYRERDAVEKEFDDLKNELEALPLRVSTMKSFKGLMFIFFVMLILRSVLLRKARTAKLLGKFSIDDLLFEMGKLRAVNIGGVWRLTEVSKKQRTMFEKLGLPKPSGVENLVTNKTGV